MTSLTISKTEANGVAHAFSHSTGEAEAGVNSVSSRAVSQRSLIKGQWDTALSCLPRTEVKLTGLF